MCEEQLRHLAPRPRPRDQHAVHPARAGRACEGLRRIGLGEGHALRLGEGTAARHRQCAQRAVIAQQREEPTQPERPRAALRPPRRVHRRRVARGRSRLVHRRGAALKWPRLVCWRRAALGTSRLVRQRRIGLGLPRLVCRRGVGLWPLRLVRRRAVRRVVRVQRAQVLEVCERVHLERRVRHEAVATPPTAGRLHQRRHHRAKHPRHARHHRRARRCTAVTSFTSVASVTSVTSVASSSTATATAAVGGGAGGEGGAAAAHTAARPAGAAVPRQLLGRRAVRLGERRPEQRLQHVAQRHRTGTTG